MRIKDRLFRLPPCPPYDVEATESWLEDMAAQGWMLEKDSIFLGVAAFDKAEPASVRYRLEAWRPGSPPGSGPCRGCP